MDPFNKKIKIENKIKTIEANKENDEYFERNKDKIKGRERDLLLFDDDFIMEQLAKRTCFSGNISFNQNCRKKCQKDCEKYETARKLKKHIDKIRESYTSDLKSKLISVKQRALSLYFIDKLTFGAWNEETTDTVCYCSLRMEHITLDDVKDGKKYVVNIDYFGKNSIRYTNSVAVKTGIYKSLKHILENKRPHDKVFDCLNTKILNNYLNCFMGSLTAKVFHTYNASNLLQEQLELLTKEEMSIPGKLFAYSRASKAVAVLCKHQKAGPIGFSKSKETLRAKIEKKTNEIRKLIKVKKETVDGKKDVESNEKYYNIIIKNQLLQLDNLKKLEVQATNKKENKQTAFEIFKLNYLDPRISVAWCKKWNVPIEKVFSCSERQKFLWAIKMAGPDYKF